MSSNLELMETSAPLKVIWFTRVLGFHVQSKRRVPRMGVMGGIRYQDVWVLQPGTRVR